MRKEKSILRAAHVDLRWRRIGHSTAEAGAINKDLLIASAAVIGRMDMAGVKQPCCNKHWRVLAAEPVAGALPHWYKNEQHGDYDWALVSRLGVLR